MAVYIFGVLVFLSTFILKWNEPHIKGWLGERKVSALLHSLDSNTYTVLNDLYIPTENGQTTQIDHILISRKGIFVIEMKNYTGWIFGTEKSPSWTKVRNKHKQPFQNPIRQNYGHIKALQNLLGDSAADVPVYSIIVFGRNAALKFKEPFHSAAVIGIGNLLKTIEMTGEKDSVSHFRCEKISQSLQKLYINDKHARKQQRKNHIRAIKGTLAERKVQVAAGICPTCGGHLIKRQGQYGSFRGCSNYPRCHFIA
ncbi:hypothetical protein A8F94_01445 [Bacillus sp. FJAT-27225]|uniref:nuclease-related domain-containing protein n=1 Tax=Bacillus sp. FJAT-27225 TaxID=1743144 RepID=UPI00080C298A|nr:NERD domain-containing protein [Bacillus sp. FJAT-27225]OCA90574.1 hypothetical protein A8F94_01445 [Bacillus sp. FJAT-27225]